MSCLLEEALGGRCALGGDLGLDLRSQSRLSGLSREVFRGFGSLEEGGERLPGRRGEMSRGVL
jgi:hypothetical protein